MSRIYEALQKAESERKADRPDRTVVPAEHAAPADPYETAVAVFDSPAATVAPDHSEVAPIDLVEVAEAPLGAPAEVLNLNNVPRRAWMPSYERLPALQERGAAV